MFARLLSAAETLAAALQNLVPPGLRGLDVLTPDRLDEARPGRSVQLVLPVSRLLRQDLEIAVGESMPSLNWLAAQVEVLTPWDQSAFLWDARVSGRRINLALVPLRPVEEAGSFLAAKDLRVAEVVAQGGFCFRRDTAQMRRWRDRLALSSFLITLLALVLAGVGANMALQAHDRAGLAEAALQRTAARLREGAGPAQAALALLPRKADSVALALTHLAAALPQDSYLTTLSVSADGFEISGQTARPEGIIPALSADSVFGHVDFAGPASRNADSGSFTFTIRGKLVAP